MKPQQSTGRHDTMVMPGQTIVTESIPWDPPPKFAGIFLRHLVTGKNTGGRMSLYHVRIDPGCAIGDHNHAGQVEIHDVLPGAGSCTLAGTKIPYTPGIAGVMPADQVYRVDAGDKGLLLLATFSLPHVLVIMKNNNIPCCAADALRRIRQIPINGIPTGICMLDECIAEVKTQDLTSDREIRAALLKRIKVYNYIPPSVEEEYTRALVEEFRKSFVKK